ncbi:MAG: polysaccharide biosynthesis tyrosine autokinase [Planctomycetes bacterium]|nr:polysaccharide biosynthesis tyrosine autokinase [Planctomycetota bacterium]
MEKHSEDQISLEDYWRIIWRRKWMIGLFVFTITLAVLIGSFMMAPIYESSTTLHMKEQKPSLFGGNLFGSGVSALSTLEEINTQIAIMNSRSVLEEVITKIGLIEKFENEKELVEAERFQAALAELRNSISAIHIRNTRLIKVSIRSKDPELAMEMANSISQAFIEKNVESKRGEANAVLSFVSEQLVQVSEKLEKAEEELLRYKEAEGIGVLNEEARLKVDRLAQLESSYQEAKVAREILDTRIAALLSQIGPAASTDVPLASISSNPAVRIMQDQLTEVQMELARLESGSYSDNQRVAAVKARIDSLKREIQVEIARSMRSGKSTAVDSALQMKLAEYQSKDVVLAAQEDALRNLIKVHEEDINKLPAREINLIRLERARRINDELYAVLMRAKNEAQIEAASQIGNIDVIDPAVTPLKPVRPKKKKNVIIGLVSSLILGIMLAFLLEYLDNTVKSEDEVKRLLRIPILGLIPRFDIDGHRYGLKMKHKGANLLTLVTRDNPKSPVSEAFRLLRANLHFMDLDKKLKTIVVTSPIPGDGKTTIAANLSIVLAAQEERILIVDADFRVPAVHKIFNLPDSPGITNILLEGTSYQNVIHKVDGVENLNVLTSGPIPPSSSELLGSSRMKKLIYELRDGYDRIIFDVPPVLVATDAVDLAYSLDGVLLVLRIGEIDKRAIKRIRELFDNAKIKILGGILNSVDTRDSRYSYDYYYYYETAEKRNGSS